MVSVRQQLGIEESIADLRAIMVDASRPLKRGRPKTDPVEKTRLALGSSLYAFATLAIGRDRLVPRIHGPWCETVQNGPERQLWLCPRGSYKTTLFSEALPLWLLANTPDERILMVSYTQRLASAYLHAIRQHTQRSELLRELWGPWHGGERENITEWSVPNRKQVHKEPSITCAGGDVAVTSGHYTWIIVDDLVGPKDRESRATREAHKRYLTDLIPLLEPGGRLIIVGTRWHREDLYSAIIEGSKRSGRVGVYVYPAERDGVPLMPEIEGMDRAGLDAKREEVGITQYASQYLLEPIAPESQLFHLERMAEHFYEPDTLPAGGAWYVYADPSLGRTARSDYTAILSGYLLGDTLYIDRGDIARHSPSQFPGRMEAAMQCNPRKAGCESNAFQELLAQAVRDRGSRVESIENHGKKEVRIEALEGPISAGRIRFRSDWQWEYPLLIQQLIDFPQGDHDDGPDALAGLWSLSRQPKFISDSPEILSHSMFHSERNMVVL